MTSSIKLSASLIAANYARLGEEVVAINGTDCDYVHIDVMDGHFVPNITIGPEVIKALRPYTSKVFDVHLMIEPVLTYLDHFVEAGSDIITIHAEATSHIDRTLQAIRHRGCKAGLALNPATSPHVVEYVLNQLDLILVMTVNPGFYGQSFLDSQLDKIRHLRTIIGSRPIDLGVDGGVTSENAERIVSAGATLLVAGSAIFHTNQYTKNIAALRRTITKHHDKEHI